MTNPILSWLNLRYYKAGGKNKAKIKIQKPQVYQDSFSASLEAIRQIEKLCKPPYTLMVSGGIDSQAMLWAWIKSGIDFTPVHFRYIDRNGTVFNDHDSETLKLIESMHGINIEYRDYYPLDFLRHNLTAYATEYQCTSPQLTMHMHMIDSFKEGTVILSGNPILQTFPFNYTQLGLARFSEYKTNISVIPFFFLFSHDLAFSFQPTINRFRRELKINDAASLSAYIYKYYTYMYSGFSVIPQISKLTGFEKIKEYFDDKDYLITAKDRLRFARKPSKRIYDIKFRYLMETLVEPFDEDVDVEYT